MKPLSSKALSIVSELENKLNNEHICGCDSDTCDINVAFENGYTLWALYLFDSCGAASDEFNELYAKLPKVFYKHARAEADHMCDHVEHAQCPHCNAVVWHDGNHGSVIHCDSCARSFPNPDVQND